MKLLIDENPSPTLAAALADLFPGSLHVRDAGLASSDDASVWEAAKAGGYTILSKDDDFHQRSFAFGAPPKVVGIRLGNRTTRQIIDLIRARADDIRALEGSPQAAYLTLP